MIFGLRMSARAIVSICCSPAGEIGSAAPSAFGQSWKEPVDAIERPAVRRRQARQGQVFLDIEAAKDTSLFRHELDTCPRDSMGRLAGKIATVKQDPAGTGLHQTHQRFQGRALACTVAAKQRHDL